MRSPAEVRRLDLEFTEWELADLYRGTEFGGCVGVTCPHCRSTINVVKLYQYADCPCGRRALVHPRLSTPFINPAYGPSFAVIDRARQIWEVHSVHDS